MFAAFRASGVRCIPHSGRRRIRNRGCRRPPAVVRACAPPSFGPLDVRRRVPADGAALSRPPPPGADPRDRLRPPCGDARRGPHRPLRADGTDPRNFSICSVRRTPSPAALHGCALGQVLVALGRGVQVPDIASLFIPLPTAVPAGAAAIVRARAPPTWRDATACQPVHRDGAEEGVSVQHRPQNAGWCCATSRSTARGTRSQHLDRFTATPATHSSPAQVEVEAARAQALRSAAAGLETPAARNSGRHHPAHAQISGVLRPPRRVAIPLAV